MITGRKQRVFGYREGDCYRACIATVTGIPYENIPHFCANENIWWFRDTVRFLKFYKLNIFMLKANKEELDLVKYLNKPVMAGGPSPRFRYNCGHVVVFKKDKIIFDPHPDNTGIKFIEDFTIILPNQSYRIENNRLYLN